MREVSLKNTWPKPAKVLCSHIQSPWQQYWVKAVAVQEVSCPAKVSHLTCRWLLRTSSKCRLWLTLSMVPSCMPSDGISLLSARKSSRRMSFILIAATTTQWHFTISRHWDVISHASFGSLTEYCDRPPLQGQPPLWCLLLQFYVATVSQTQATHTFSPFIWSQKQAGYQIGHILPCLMTMAERSSFLVKAEQAESCTHTSITLLQLIHNLQCLLGGHNGQANGISLSIKSLLITCTLLQYTSKCHYLGPDKWNKLFFLVVWRTITVWVKARITSLSKEDSAFMEPLALDDTENMLCGNNLTLWETL